MTLRRHSGQGTTVPSSLSLQSTAEPSPLLSDPQGDVSSCTVCEAAAQRGLVWHGLQVCWRVQPRRGRTMETIRDRGDGPMAQKGQGIFLVYVDIDAQHDKEFNEWYNT